LLQEIASQGLLVAIVLGAILLGVLMGIFLKGQLVSRDESETPQILSVFESWDESRFEHFFGNFLTREELDILKALATVLVMDANGSLLAINDITIGWRNKHKIHLASGVSRKLLYKGQGLADRLYQLGLLVQDDGPLPGPEKLRYRVNTDNYVMLSYTEAVLRSLGEKLNDVD
jgi:hypothetical protein